MKLCLRLVAVVAAVAVVARTVSAQVVEQRVPKWELLVGIGRAGGPGAESFERDFRTAGLGAERVSPGPAPERGLVLSVDLYPRIIPAVRARQFAVLFHVSPSLQLRGQFSSSRLGSVVGYHGIENEGLGSAMRTIGTHVAFAHEVRAVAVVAVARVTSLLRIGIGPALHTVTQRGVAWAGDSVHARAAVPAERRSRTVLGGVVHAAIVSSSTRRVFVELAAQVHVMPPVDFGSRDVILADSRETLLAVPHSRYSALHAELTAGIGFRP